LVNFLLPLHDKIKDFQKHSKACALSMYGSCRRHLVGQMQWKSEQI